MANTVEVTKQIDMGRNASESFTPMNKVGDDGTGVWIYMDWVETIDRRRPITK